MEIEEYIDKIIDNGKIEDMETLSDMLEETMNIVKDYDKECYDKFMMKLYEMAYGKVLSKSMAEKIVNKMRPYRERWSFNETQKIQEQYGLNNIRREDFYIVINSAYNDYKDLFGENIEDYIKFTIDFIQDEDAKPNKVFTYYTMIPNE